MKTSLILFFGIAIVASVTADEAQKFSLGLYKTLATASENAGKNIAISPFSVETALKMAYLGASSSTKSEIGISLGVTSDATPESMGKKFKSIRSTSAGFVLSSANKIFLEKTFPILPAYKAHLVSHFQSDISEADFQNNANAERVKINSYVEQKTNNKIKDLLPTASLDGNTKLVIVNAVYFKANWTQQFKKDSTYSENFSPLNGQPKSVDMMHQDANFPYMESSELDGAQVLEMKYLGEETSMVVILPKKTANLQNVETKLTPATLQSVLGKLKREYVAVSFPKFKVETSYELGKPLKAMGIKQAFENGADFSGITSRNIKISKVVHKVFVQVDEDGTEAAGATALMFVGYSSTTQPRIKFNVDRPFLFLIRHIPTKTILFMGRVMDPSQ